MCDRLSVERRNGRGEDGREKKERAEDVSKIENSSETGNLTEPIKPLVAEQNRYPNSL